MEKKQDIETELQEEPKKKLERMSRFDLDEEIFGVKFEGCFGGLTDQDRKESVMHEGAFWSGTASGKKE